MRVMTVKEAAAELRVGRKTVNRLITAGQLVASNVGSTLRPRLRITEEAVAAYLTRSRLTDEPARSAG